MKKKIIMMGIIGLMGLMVLSVVGLSGCYDNNTTRDFNVLVTDAPTGKYWVHNYGEFHGGFLFFYGYVQSDLRNSYTMKFMDGKELKTLILSAMDPRLHVILTDDNTSMNLSIKLDLTQLDMTHSEPTFYRGIGTEPSSDGTVYVDGCRYVYTFTLYIPRPEICTISNETGE